MKARHLGLAVGMWGVIVAAQFPFGCDSGAGPGGGQGGEGGDTAGPMTATTSTGASTTGAGGSMTSTTGAGGSMTNTTSVASGPATTTSSSTMASSSAAGTGSGGGVTISPGNMIDDMEAGTGSILMQGGRIGAWYTYNDMSPGGMQTPLQGGPFIPEIIPGGNGTSMRAAHTYGNGFTIWGAGMGFDLNNDGATKMTYSASGFNGLAFWAKGSPSIRVKVLVEATVPTSEGGTCSANCSDNHGIIVNLTPNWVQYTAPFASFTQEGWGTPVPFDTKHILAVQFQVGAGASFDFWIDDIGFY